MQMVCKHKLALIKLDPKMLADPSQVSELQAIAEWPSYPALKTSIEEFEKDLAEIEREKSIVTQREKKRKASLAYELTFGRKMPDGSAQKK